MEHNLISIFIVNDTIIKQDVLITLPSSVVLKINIINNLKI